MPDLHSIIGAGLFVAILTTISVAAIRHARRL